jgi:uncharacterized protein
VKVAVDAYSGESQSRGVGAGSLILPDLPGRTAEFWRGVQEGKLLLQKCRRCNRVWHPLRDACDACQSFEFEWVPSVGTGVLYSYTVVHHAVHSVVRKWVPYTLCLIQLDEGPRVLSTIDPDAGEELEIGCRVELKFRRIRDDFQLPVFTLNTR